MIQKGFREWAVIVSGLGIIVIVLVFSAIRIEATAQWLTEHRAYIHSRDERWDAFMANFNSHVEIHEEQSKELLLKQQEMMEQLEQIKKMMNGKR